MISSGSCCRGCVRKAPNDFPRSPSIVDQDLCLVDVCRRGQLVGTGKFDPESCSCQPISQINLRWSVTKFSRIKTEIYFFAFAPEVSKSRQSTCTTKRISEDIKTCLVSLLLCLLPSPCVILLVPRCCDDFGIWLETSNRP